MAHHVRVFVSGADVVQVYASEFFVCGALCEGVLIEMLLRADEVVEVVRLMLVPLRSTASFSTSAHTPSLSRIRAMLGASWIPAPTKPKLDAVS